MMATETTTTETRKNAPRGFPGLCCIKCGHSGEVHIALEDMTLSCSECSETYGPEEVRDVIAAWTRVLSWIELSPKL